MFLSDKMRRCDGSTVAKRTDRVTDEALERGRKKRAIEIIEDARALGAELMEEWDEQ
jgi:hypothetical protein